jgi:hypothetical protein
MLLPLTISSQISTIVKSVHNGSRRNVDRAHPTPWHDDARVVVAEPIEDITAEPYPFYELQTPNYAKR